MEEINKDYIGVITEISDGLNSGLLEYQKIPIQKSVSILKVITEKLEDDQCTIFDVQDSFMKVFPKETSPKTIAYLYPENYKQRYVYSAHYPKLTVEQESEYAEFHIVEKHKFDDYIVSYMKRFEFDKLSKIEKLDSKKWLILRELIQHWNLKDDILDNVRKMIDQTNDIESLKDAVLHICNISLNKRYKNMYGRHYLRYIWATDYQKTLCELKAKSNIKMYSTDSHGRSTFDYIINDDIVITVKTNFAYGNASYFFCNLKYKGVCILPYTEVVRYYYVNWTDLLRYTHKYYLDRTQWMYLFDYVVRITNLAKSDFETFKKEILRDIEAMMDEVIRIFESPLKVLDCFMNVKYENQRDFALHSSKNGVYSLVRNISNDDIEEYEVLPEEKAFAFKVEKITGCLSLMDNLNDLEDFLPEVKKYIATLVNLNTKIHIEIMDMMNKLTKEVTQMTKELEIEKNKFYNFGASIISIYVNCIEYVINEEDKIIEKLNNEHSTVEDVKTLYSVHTNMKDYLDTFRDSLYIKLKKSFKGESYEENDAFYNFANHKYYERCKTAYCNAVELHRHIRLRKNFINVLNKGLERIKQYTNNI